MKKRKSIGHVLYSHIVWDENNPDDKWQPGYVIHHIDGDPLNDNINNLEKMTLSDHSKMHSTGEGNAMYGSKRVGELNPFFQKKHSEKSLKKMSESHKGTKATLETRIKMSNSRKGDKNPMYGVPSPMTGKHHGEETKKKISDYNKNRVFSEETKKKMSESAKNKWKDIDKRNSLVKSMIGRKVSIEGRNNLSKAMFDRWAKVRENKQHEIL